MRPVSRPQDTDVALPEDTLLLSFSVYHPLKGYKTQEWLFVSNQTFRELQKAIYCMADHLVSPRPVAFKIGNFKPNLDTKLEDVMMAVGECYSYVHADCCEHMMLLTDIRLLQPTDSLIRLTYPLQTFACRTRRRKCETCLKHFAAIVVVDHEMLEKQTVYLCGACFQGLYPDGVGEFVAYPYYHD